MGSMGCPGRPLSVTLAVLIALRIAPTTTAPTTSVYDPRSGQHVPRDAYLETMAAFSRRAEANITRCAAERGAPLSPVTPGRVVVWHPLAGSGLGNQLEALANAVLYSLISSRRLELTSFENAPHESLVAYLCTVFDCGYPASTRSKEEIKRMPNYKPHKPCDEAFFNEKRGLSCHARSNTTLLRMASSTRMGGYGASSKNPWASCVGRLLGCYGFATGDNCAVGQALRLALPGVAQPLLDVAGRRFNGSVARLQRALDAPKPTHLYSAALHIRTVDNAMIHELNPNVSAHAIERLILGNNPFWHCIRKKLAAQIDESGIRRVFVASDNAYLHERLPSVLALGDDVEVEFFNFGVRPHTGAACAGHKAADCDSHATAAELLEQTAPFLDWATLSLAEHIFALRLNSGTCSRILRANGDPAAFDNPGGVYTQFDSGAPEPAHEARGTHFSNTFVRGAMSTFVNTASMVGEAVLSSLRSAKSCDFASRPKIDVRPAAHVLI